MSTARGFWFGRLSTFQGRRLCKAVHSMGTVVRPYQMPCPFYGVQFKMPPFHYGIWSIVAAAEPRYGLKPRPARFLPQLHSELSALNTWLLTPLSSLHA